MMKPVIMTKNTDKKPNEAIEKMAIQATTWIGSTQSLFAHTIFFIAIFLLHFWGVAFEQILLIVTTIVSYEAIYLAIFIQMSVNRQEKSLQEVAMDVDEIQKDVDEIQEDVEDISEEMEEDDEENEIIATQTKDNFMKLTIMEETLRALTEEIAELKKAEKKK